MIKNLKLNDSQEIENIHYNINKTDDYKTLIELLPDINVDQLKRILLTKEKVKMVGIKNIHPLQRDIHPLQRDINDGNQ